MKRALVGLCAVCIALAIPATALARTGLRGSAKLAVERAPRLYPLNQTGVPFRGTTWQDLNCTDAYQSTVNKNWAGWFWDGHRHPQCNSIVYMGAAFDKVVNGQWRFVSVGLDPPPHVPLNVWRALNGCK